MRLTDVRWTAVLLCAAALAAAGCGKEVVEESGTAPVVAPPLPAGVLVAAEPAGAKDVAEVKASAKEGDEVVVRGRVGGSKRPVMEGRAIFTLADATTLKACTERPGDTCPTPWDFCCETPDDIAASTLTVEVVGADGRPLAADLAATGVKPLTEVVVRGKVGPRPDPKVLVVDATEVFVKP